MLRGDGREYLLNLYVPWLPDRLLLPGSRHDQGRRVDRGEDPDQGLLRHVVRAEGVQRRSCRCVEGELVRRLRPGRDQPVDPQAHARRRTRCRARPRRQGQPRRERRVPPSRVGRVRRDAGARRPRADGQGEGPPVHRPRRLGGDHRQRRRAGDVDARRGQPGRRGGVELPRHRWRRQRRRDVGGARRDQPRRQRALGLHQHLRRHHAWRGGGQRHRRGRPPRRTAGADRHPPRRHERRGGSADPGRVGHPAGSPDLATDHARRRTRPWRWPRSDHERSVASDEAPAEERPAAACVAGERRRGA